MLDNGRSNRSQQQQQQRGTMIVFDLSFFFLWHFAKGFPLVEFLLDWTIFLHHWFFF
jgi:hypothetical protein